MAKKTLIDKNNQNEDTNKNNEDVFNEDEEPNFSDDSDEEVSDEGQLLNSLSQCFSCNLKLK